MGILRTFVVAVFAVATCLGAEAQTPQRRIALVIGEGAYADAALPVSVNDAGLVAQALNDAGFEIVEGRDLDLTGMQRLIRDFLTRIQKSGPDTAVAVYISGYVAQLEGDNYLLPVDAHIDRESDIAMAGFRLSDMVRSLNAATEGTRIIVVDAPRGFPALRGKAVASGLALVEAPQGMLIAYATAPGNMLPDNKQISVAGNDGNDYGVYARALVEQIYQPDVEADEVFKRTRLRVHEMTAGVQVPWHDYELKQPFVFMSGQASVPLPVPRPATIETPEEAYGIAIEADTISGYQSFLKLYPDHALAKRVKVLLANRREAVFWSKTVRKGTVEAYWTYLKSYPKGPHVADARRRLEMLSRPVYPPEDFPVAIYDDVPPPIDIETMYETTYAYDDYSDYYGYPPPPPPPVYILPPLRPIPWQPPLKPERPGLLPTPPRPSMLPPPVWRDKPQPPRAAPIVSGPPVSKERPVGSPMNEPGIAKERPPGLPRPPQPGIAAPPGDGARPPIMKDRGPVQQTRPAIAPLQPQNKMAPQPVPERAGPAPNKAPERTAPNMPRPSQGQPNNKSLDATRPPAMPAAPADKVQQRQRPAPVQRPAAQPRQPAQIERPAQPVEKARPPQVERPASAPVRQREAPRQLEHPAAPAPKAQPSPPPQMERRSAPAMESPRAMERPTPSARPGPGPSRSEPRDKSRRPGAPRE